MSFPTLEFDDTKIELLKNTICKGATNEEFQLFLHACKRTGLDPFMRQIYAYKRWDSTVNKNVIMILVAIDGYRLIAERTGRYSPGKETVYEYNDDKTLRSATVYLKKQTQDGTWHEINATAFFSEYCAKNKEGKPMAMWAKMPNTMLEKCAEAKALRRAFPAELSGVYTKEEMDQAENPVEQDIIVVERNTDLDPQPVSAKEEPKPKSRPKEDCITTEQLEEFEKVWKLCSEDHRKTRAKILTKAPHFMNSLAEMPKNIYEKELELARLNAQIQVVTDV